MISNNFSDICGGNGYIRLLSNVCVKLSRVNCTLQEAVSNCSSDNATLFHIGTSDKYYSIIYLIKSMSGTFVIQDINVRFIFIVSFLYFSHGQVYSIQHNEIKCVSDLRNATGFLFVFIFFTSRGQVYSIQPYEKSVSVTCGMLLVFSLYLYFSLPMVRCTRYNLMKKSMSVTCGMLLDFSVHLYFSLPMIRCTR
jgi:hypothetical protein